MPLDTDQPTSAGAQWQFLDALGDGIYGVDGTGACTFINIAALRLLGYASADELIGRNMHAAIHHTRPDGTPFPQAECPLLHTTSSGRPVRLNNEMLFRRNGTPFFAEYSSFPIMQDGAVAGSIITFTDTSVRQDAQKRLAVQYAVAQVLAGDAPEEAIPARLLEAIGTGLDWEAGLFWRRVEQSEGHDVLRCMAVWSANNAGTLPAHFSVGRTLELGAGLPGHVWLMEAPLHVADLSVESPILISRGVGDARSNLRSGFAFPIMDATYVVGAIEFYSRTVIEPDESLLEAVTTLGHQIGQTLARRVTTARLGESEHLKAAILASAPDGVITFDAHERIVEFNAAAEAIFGRAVADILGRNLSDVIFPADTQQAHQRAFHAALDGDDTLLGRRVEVDAIRADGTRFPIELSITRTARGRQPLFTAHLREITARRAEQAALRQSEARFRTIANAIPQLAWMTDETGSITWYNDRWYDYTGTTLAEMSGWGWKKVHHPDHVERVEKHLRESFASGTVWEDTFPLRSRAGDYAWFLSRAMPIRDDPEEACPQGRIVGWFGTNTDVTAMRETEQKLAAARDEAEDANRAKSTFIANMSHELRTPLSAIIGYSEMLIEEIEDGAPPAAELLRDMGKIESNARHLLGLINDVLDLSKVESGKMEAYAETFDIASVTRDVAATVSALMEKKSNRLELRLPPALGTMHSDVTRIRQVILNLLSNAAKFTEHGLITLSVERATDNKGQDWISFAVADTGIGMSQAQLAKLFQRFHQADASTTRQFGGTGLGLALTKAFATLLDGTITATSEPGHGSIFTLRVPAHLAANGAATEPASEPAPPPAAQANDRDVILVVDDDATQRDLMSRFLIRNGFSAQTAPDGAAGLELAKTLRPRAILLDVTMPGMDGWSVLGALKADPALSNIPVVMVTFVNERAVATSLGAADYIVKPVDWERLRSVMERFRERDGDVLVVEDDPDARSRTRQALERNGWTVVEAEDGRQGLNCVVLKIPRVILLDLNMPVMDGFGFLASLRQIPGCEQVPVVVLTALDLSADDRRRLRGASQILNKGDVNLSDLAERLRSLGTSEAPQ